MKKYLLSLLVASSCLSLGSCDKWLTVTPDTEMSADETFKTELGIKDALAGVYVLMKDGGLYGANLSYSYIDNMASLWDVTASSIEEGFHLHQYSRVTGQVDQIYGKLYNAIANVNNILKYIELNKDVIKTPGLYDAIRGECFALRAYLHFDLMRLFGPIPSLPEGAGAKLSYMKSVTSSIQMPVSFEEYRVAINQDITEAEKYLSNDPIRQYSIEALRTPTEFAQIKELDDFFANRTVKMNYYAVHALKARVAVWYGDKELAYEAATEVINAKNENGTAKFDISGIRKALLDKSDNLLVCEQIFGLFDYNLSDKFTQYFSNANLYKGANSTNIKTTLFGNTGKDIRELNQWELKTLGDASTRYTTNKYKASGMNRQIPMIRLSELYLIAIECGPTSQAQLLYNKFLEVRSLDARPVFKNEVDLRKEILLQFRKEFYAEGQLFYLYKRYNSPRVDILFANPSLLPNYILPLPITEIKK
ncbi:RagB/SusD family nutrient uptake outer membrane protein [Sphingobacterium lumbrici]|uniref:RagB/SusD family nutrient uptake outer membrane protein n=1 Tax=Sphingobacterium lumbrici TaxID=2559600 RepID=UPI0015E370FB|nr:RagB/SusD family nutrient uptake outer membrane protein [Sphingobacterium lumbrici]